MNLLIATKNPGKFKEISAFLQMPGLKLLSLSDFPKVKEPEETGATFKENARIKAAYYAKKFKIISLADDGGLEIEIFNGEPGVKSRRWIDGVHEASDKELIDYCLEKMKGAGNRKAKLTACLCLYICGGGLPPASTRGEPPMGAGTAPLQLYAQESISGIIAETPSENRFTGFPFRSLLWIPEIKKFYNEDELTWEETVKYNHRYKAIQEIKYQISNIKYQISKIKNTGC